MTSWLTKVRQKRDIQKFKRLFKNLPSSVDKKDFVKQIVVGLLKEVILTKEGLVFIDPFDILSDKEGNLYVYVRKDSGYAQFSPVYTITDDDEERVSSIWPSYLT